ncbi:MAG: hypothetical protein P1T08_05300 [Acidimicrobiia bacterium]|nr:hypothetical protein [Acidimicrobiia bacterium]
MFRRIFIAWLLLAVAVVGSAGIAGAASSDESSMVALINAERVANGQNTLQVYWDLTDDARAWTAVMIGAGEISHNPNLAGVTSGWSSLGENVGVGPNVDRLHSAFMDSSGHRANILGNYNYIGIGADRAPDGNLYITVVFMLGPDGLVSPPTTTTTAPPTTTTTTGPGATTTTTAPPPAATTTTTAPPTTSTTQPRTASAAPTPFFADATVSAGHLSIHQRVVYPCTEGMILAPTSRIFCVV